MKVKNIRGAVDEVRMAAFRGDLPVQTLPEMADDQRPGGGRRAQREVELEKAGDGRAGIPGMDHIQERLAALAPFARRRSRTAFHPAASSKRFEPGGIVLWLSGASYAVIFCSSGMLISPPAE